MPLHDYGCPTCGLVLPDVYRSIEEGGQANPPTCPEDPGVVMHWIPQVGAMDAGGGGAFKPFEVDVQGVPTMVSSLHQVRQIERDSEQRFINGEGEPLRFRAYNQDTSNKDVSAFGHQGEIGTGASKRIYSDGQQPTKKAKIGVQRHGETKPKIPLGPGMKRAASALKG